MQSTRYFYPILMKLGFSVYFFFVKYSNIKLKKIVLWRLSFSMRTDRQGRHDDIVAFRIIAKAPKIVGIIVDKISPGREIYFGDYLRNIWDE